MLAWVALFFLRDDPFALCGRTVRDWAVLAALSAITLAVLLVAARRSASSRPCSWEPASSCSTPYCTRTP
jgi:hypothetical protein